MEIVEINEENLDEFVDYIDEDVAESIGRKYYRGMGIIDDSEDILGSLIWEYKNSNDDDDTLAELVWLSLEQGAESDELFEAFKEDAEFENVKKSFFELENPDEVVAEALTAQSFKTKKRESRDIYTTVGELAGLSIARKKPPSYIVGLFDLTVKQYRQGIITCLYKGRKGLVEDLAVMPMGWYDMDVSCAVRTDGEITGFLLVHRYPSGILAPVFLFASGPNSKMDLLNMLRYAIRSAAEEFSPETSVLIRRHNPAVKALSDKLFPGVKGDTVLYGERKE
ncbi:MAG: hypothetical protein IKO61_12610 [Lachnospiraceae bacterium]|nr:hypothetical protein [Lachnospiraceae bacterium]